MNATHRKPWLAALLSLLLAGLGHLYAGSPRRALVFFAGEVVGGLVWVALVAFWDAAPWNFFAGAAVSHGWRLFAAVNAFRCARRQPASVGRSAWVRWPAYLVVLAIGHYVPIFAVRAVAFEAFDVPARSMSDTLIPGDRLIATKWDVGSLERGELIVFRTPAGENFVGRAIGLPGETVEVRDGIASVDGEPLAEPYVRIEGRDFGAYGPSVVPPQSYFVLGDNRNNSRDSRFEDIGFVHSSRIVGQARAIFWSTDPGRLRIRWDRIGRSLR